MLRGLTQPGGQRQADGREGIGGVGNAQRVEHPHQPHPQRLALIAAQRRGGERRQQQHDAEIGVAAGHLPRRRDGVVFKNGRLVARNGELTATGRGDTIVVRPEFDRTIERRLKPWFEDHQTVRLGNLRVADGEILDHGRGGLSIVPTLTASDSCF